MKTLALVGIIASGLLLLTIMATVRALKHADAASHDRTAHTHGLVSFVAVLVMAATLAISWIIVRGA